MANIVDPDQTAPIGAVCSGSTLFASILNLSVMLGNYLQQTTECVCGDIETVHHFILECPLYEDNHQKLQKNLFLQLGIPILDMDLLFSYSENENFSGWRESVLYELGQYIANTGRLFSRVADVSAPQ